MQIGRFFAIFLCLVIIGGALDLLQIFRLSLNSGEGEPGCAAPALQAGNHNVYCADSAVHLTESTSFAECQFLCGFQSSCEFYSFWTAGDRSGLCKITSSCDQLLPVEDKTEVVNVYKRTVPSSSHQSYLQLMGMYDSGTNLMLATLARNFPFCCHQVHRPDISVLQVAAAAHGRCLQFGAFDKHGSPWQLQALQGQHLPWDGQMVIVLMLRDPLSQIQSWKKAPYGLSHCVKRRHCPRSAAADCMRRTAWITERCRLWTPGEPGTGSSGKAFKSLPGVWNGYTGGYVKLQQDLGARGILVRFEDLVADPMVVIRRISAAVKMDLEDVAVVEGVAKPHGRSKNRSAAMQSVAARDFIREYSLPELIAVCIRLNFSLTERVGYPVKECEPYKERATPEVLAKADGVIEKLLGRFAW